MWSTPAPPSTARVAASIWSGHRRREDLAGARGVEHAAPDETAVQRLVTGAAAGDDPDLALDRRVAPDDELLLVVHPELRVRGLDAAQRLGDDVGGVVDQLLHGYSWLGGHWRY